MLKIKATIREKGATPRLMRREINAIKRAAFEGAGVQWHDEFRLKHFTLAGAREYGYSPRQGDGLSGKAFWRSYQGRKQKYLGHQIPLVYSGEAQRMSEFRAIRATSTSKKSQVTIAMARLQKLNWRHPNSQIDMADEMRRVSAGEERILVGTIQRGIDSRLAAMTSTHTTVIS